MKLGEPLTLREEIIRPEVNYRALEALNVSMIKLYDTDPIKFFEQYILRKPKKDKKTTSLIIGDLVDTYLLEARGNEDEFNKIFDDKFALMSGTKGSGQVFKLADILFEITQENLDEDGKIKTSFDTRFTEAFQKVQAEGLYKGKTEDKVLEDFNKNGYDYFQSLVDNIGKIVVDASIIDKATKVGDLMLHDDFTSSIFAEESDDEEYFPKFPIEWTYRTSKGKEIKCKSEIDILIVDHKKKIIYVKDLKTTFDNENFQYAYLKYGYYLQGAFYYLAAQAWAKDNDMGDYEVDNMEFVVADTSVNNRRPIRFKQSLIDFNNALHGFSIKGTHYKGLIPLIEEIAWAEETNTWNCSKEVFDNRGRLKLNIKYD